MIFASLFGAAVLSALIDFVLFAFGNTLDNVAVEYAIILAKRDYVLVHIIVFLGFRHAVERASVESLLRRFIVQRKVFD